MRKHIGTVVLGLIIVAVLVLYFIAFTVRWQEKALVLTFGKISRVELEPGLKWVWPWQSVVKFDGRIRTLPHRAVETQTRDQQNIIVSVYVNWRIQDPAVFYQRFRQAGAGESEYVIVQAEKTIRDWVDEATNIFARYDFGQLVTLNRDDFKLPQIEKGTPTSMLELVRAKNLAAGRDQGDYGIEIIDLGIRQLGIPDNVTASVFDRMKEDRQAEITRLVAEGASQAEIIVGNARSEATIIQANAQAEAKKIEADGDAKAAQYYAKFLAHPELANFLRRLETLRKTLSQRTTIVIDSDSAPYNLLRTGPDMAPGTETTQ